MCSTYDCQAECALLLRLDEGGLGGSWSDLGTFGGFSFDASKLFCICEHEVHVLQKLVGQVDNFWVGCVTLSKASICPVIWRPSFNVIRIR